MGVFVIGLGQISSFFSLKIGTVNVTYNPRGTGKYQLDSLTDRFADCGIKDKSRSKEAALSISHSNNSNKMSNETEYCDNIKLVALDLQFLVILFERG